MFGKMLYRYRKENNLTQTQLAHSIGLSTATISAYENGTREPSCELLCRISQVTHISLDVLLGSNYKPPDHIEISGLTLGQRQTVVKLIQEYRKINQA